MQKALKRQVIRRCVLALSALSGLVFSPALPLAQAASSLFSFTYSQTEKMNPEDALLLARVALEGFETLSGEEQGRLDIRIYGNFRSILARSGSSPPAITAPLADQSMASLLSGGAFSQWPDFSYNARLSTLILRALFVGNTIFRRIDPERGQRILDLLSSHDVRGNLRREKTLDLDIHGELFAAIANEENAAHRPLLFKILYAAFRHCDLNHSDFWGGGLLPQFALMYDFFSRQQNYHFEDAPPALLTDTFLVSLVAGLEQLQIPQASMRIAYPIPYELRFHQFLDRPHRTQGQAPLRSPFEALLHNLLTNPELYPQPGSEPADERARSLSLLGQALRDDLEDMRSLVPPETSDYHSIVARSPLVAVRLKEILDILASNTHVRSLVENCEARLK